MCMILPTESSSDKLMQDQHVHLLACSKTIGEPNVMTRVLLHKCAGGGARSAGPQRIFSSCYRGASASTCRSRSDPSQTGGQGSQKYCLLSGAMFLCGRAFRVCHLTCPHASILEVLMSCTCARAYAWVRNCATRFARRLCPTRNKIRRTG